MDFLYLFGSIDELQKERFVGFGELEDVGFFPAEGFVGRDWFCIVFLGVEHQPARNVLIVCGVFYLSSP